jgi:hypothetical protein
MNLHHPADILHEYHVRFYDSTISLVPDFKESSHNQPSKLSEESIFSTVSYMRIFTVSLTLE